MDPIFGLFVLLVVLFGPVVVVALLANRAQRRTFEAMVPQGAAETPVEREATQVEMLAVASPLRLGALRALGCGLVLALPAVFLATGPRGPMREHVAWLVLAGHAALSVGAAAVAERWAARRARPMAGGALAGLAALMIMGAGLFQARATAEVLLGGGAEKALGELEALMREPAAFLATVARLAIVLTFTWAVPCAAITYGQLDPRAHPVLVVALVTVCAGAPAALTLACCYLAASTLDGWLPRRAPPGDA